jgi:beta-glucosidase
MRRLSLITICLVSFGALVAPVTPPSGVAAAASACPWLDVRKSPDAAARQLLKAMTLDEKITMLHGTEPGWETYYGTAGHVPANPRLCIPDLVLNDAGDGVGDSQLNVTAYPVGLAQAATWDPALQREFGRALGDEAWHKGVNVMLGPAVNIARVPMNGRNFEYAGEDPYLAGQTAVSTARGIQDNPVIATVKHYAVNNQEINRMTTSSDVDERTLQGHVGAAMCSYNKVNGVYACEHPELLNGIMKRDWGFPGFVMSDWSATHSTAPAVNAGLDMEMNAVNNGQYLGAALKTAVQAGKVRVARVDDMVLRILRTMFRIGIFDHPAIPEPQGFLTPADTPGHLAVARHVSEQATVLLKNEDGLLPLSGTRRTIALIGAAAGPHGANNIYNGGGSSRVLSARVVTPLQGITKRASVNGDTVLYADGQSTVDAVAVASLADVAVVFANDAETEGADRADLALRSGVCELTCVNAPTTQDPMIEAVAQSNPNTVVVLNTGGPVTMPWLDRVPAVLEAWYPGQEGGNAIASVLFGDVNPSGRLPQTFPRSVNDLPTRTREQYPGVGLHTKYSEGLLVGYRWYDARKIDPLFAFGHGLSYTAFEYGAPSVTRTDHGAKVTFTLKNTGRVAGAEVAQVYVAQPAAAGEPPQQLGGYRKMFLGPGEEKTITIAVANRAFSSWSVNAHDWKLVSGVHGVAVGGSSRDIRGRATVRIG